MKKFFNVVMLLSLLGIIIIEVPADCTKEKDEYKKCWGA